MDVISDFLNAFDRAGNPERALRKSHPRSGTETEWLQAGEIVTNELGTDSEKEGTD